MQNRPIATVSNLALLLAALISFPFLLRYSGALPPATAGSTSPQHTVEFLHFSFTVTSFLWLCFAIAFFGIRRHGTVKWQELLGRPWSSGISIAKDSCAAVLTLLTLAIVGNLGNSLLGPYQHDSAALRWMVAQNGREAAAFLVLALTAGFVEEFVFRGYLQRQFTAMFGNVFLASVLQVAIFTLGHFYQGWLRLLPVALIGTVLTVAALARKSLVPGMIAHGLGDGLVSFLYLAKHL